MLGLIYFLSLFFWFRYLIRHSLLTKEDRAYTFEKVSELFIYFPVGLQDAFLFFYGVYELLPLGNKISDPFDRIVLNNPETSYPDLYALKIIVAGSLLVSISYSLMKRLIETNDKG